MKGGPTLAELVNERAAYRDKAEQLVWHTTFDFLLANMDENAKLELWWYWDRNSIARIKQFMDRFFMKYCNPYVSESSLMWSCRNVSACAVFTMREVFEG